MRTCPNGHPVPEDQAYCSTCGAFVPKEPPAPTSSFDAAPYQQTSSNTPPPYQQASYFQGQNEAPPPPYRQDPYAQSTPPPYGQQPPYSPPPQQNYGAYGAAAPGLTGFVGQVRSPGMVILLTIITCGIYGIVWMYSVAQEINMVLGDQEATKPSYAIWGILCFVMSFILMSQIDAAMVEIDRRRGIPSESKFLLWVLLSLLAGIGVYFMQHNVQSRLNALYENRPFYG